jgi:hypothetical protein
VVQTLTLQEVQTLEALMQEAVRVPVRSVARLVSAAQA